MASAKPWNNDMWHYVNTLYMDNEMILTFMMSQAQAESESLSGSVKWGHRKNFKDGKVYYHYASFLGYRKGGTGGQHHRRCLRPEDGGDCQRAGKDGWSHHGV